MRSLTLRMAIPLGLATLLFGFTAALGTPAAAQPPGPPVGLPPVPFDVEWARGVATGAGGTGVATFVFSEGAEPWATLIVRAGTADGIDRVTVSLSSETGTLTIQAEDAMPTNVVTILVNKDFVNAFVDPAGEGLWVEVSEAVNYLGLTMSDDAGGAQVYVFVVTHFSIQSIRLSPVGNGIPFSGGLTLTGWALVGTAVVLVVVAAGIALRKERVILRRRELTSPACHRGLPFQN